MAEYIEREALLEDLQAAVENGGMGGMVASALKRYVKRAPAADVAPVVRCKDCKYGDYDSEPDDAMVCTRTNDGYWRHGDDFCSYGRKKNVD